MPVKDGLSATREIREYEQQLISNSITKQSRHIPIIAVTAAGEADQIACLEAGNCIEDWTNRYVYASK